VIALLALTGLVRAQATETDIELVHPTFSARSYLGIDTPDLAENGTVRWGIVTQYERDPLVAYDRDAEIGAVISNRQATTLGFSTDFGDRFGVRAVIPFDAQWGSDVDRYSGDGFGVGDIAFGGRLHFVRAGPFQAALRADLAVPTATNGGYMGETQPRVQGGALASVALPGITFDLDASLLGRARVVTAHDFTLGPELLVNAGARHTVFEFV
jgi:hypothetical protein